MESTFVTMENDKKGVGAHDLSMCQGLSIEHGHCWKLRLWWRAAGQPLWASVSQQPARLPDLEQVSCFVISAWQLSYMEWTTVCLKLLDWACQTENDFYFIWYTSNILRYLLLWIMLEWSEPTFVFLIIPVPSLHFSSSPFVFPNIVLITCFI